ncbi:MAG: heme-binding domain-containing protein [Bacteroidetes bacterium]|nr:heme-binding domain-containing protein [Bacteroidota bacterium]
MKRRKIFRTVLWVLLAAFIGIQFIRIDKTHPPTEAGMDFLERTNPPEEIATLIKNACYDCHSHQTVYPWSSNVAPASWWLADHIRHARGEMNLSKWGRVPNRKKSVKLFEMADEVMEENMPLPSYTIMHAKARLTPEQRKMLAEWFESQK